MNKTAPSEFYRLFLIEKLPEPLTPASSHLQLFDNYIADTRLRLRKIRDPYTKTWMWTLQQHIRPEGEHRISKVSEIHLNEPEYEIFAQFEGQEIRKNRYFHEFDQVSFTFDVYLGRLFGLCTARVDLDSVESMEAYVPPPFAIFDVSGDEFFDGEQLVRKQFSEIREHFAELGSIAPAVTEMPDE
jgi:CYTH domain-containing protein